MYYIMFLFISEVIWQVSAILYKMDKTEEIVTETRMIQQKTSCMFKEENDKLYNKDR